MKLAPMFFIIGMIISGTGIAHAKSHKAHAYSFFDDGGKHNQAECDPEKKAPRKMKRKKEFARFGSYLGSELVESAKESPNGVEAWKHYFASSASCSDSLRHHPSKNP